MNKKTFLTYIFSKFQPHTSHTHIHHISIPTNKARCVSSIFSSVHRRKVFLSIRGGTKLLCAYPLEKKKDQYRIPSQGHSRCGPTRPANLLMLTELGRPYLSHGAIEAAQRARKTGAASFPFSDVLFQFFFLFLFLSLLHFLLLFSSYFYFAL